MELATAVPDRAELLRLYEAVGWTAYTADPDGLVASVAGSTHVVVAREGGVLVGLARCLSDGHTVAYLQDVLVHPDHRRAGTGRALVDACLAPFAHVRQHVLLTDDEPWQLAFHAGNGFTATTEHDPPLTAFVRIRRG